MALEPGEMEDADLRKCSVGDRVLLFAVAAINDDQEVKQRILDSLTPPELVEFWLSFEELVAAGREPK